MMEQAISSLATPDSLLSTAESAERIYERSKGEAYPRCIRI
jgi:hypothetical protein